MKLKPKNWTTFQHYKDRNPPWIKLHKDQLNKPDFMSLSLASVGLANMLWLLASESKNGVFDASMEHLTFRLRKTEAEINENLKLLINKGFFIIASDLLADDTESCSEVETETEAYKEETETENLCEREFILSQFKTTFKRPMSSADYQKIPYLMRFNPIKVEKAFSAAKGKKSLNYVISILENDKPDKPKKGRLRK